MNIKRQAARSMASSREFAIAAGVFFLITHVTSIGARLLYEPILYNPGYIIGAGPETPGLVGVLCDVILALAIVGTAVALFPVAKRVNEGIALGYVGLRTLEAGIIAAGVVPLLAVMTLRQHLAGTDTATLVALSGAFVSLYNWTFVVGPGLVCGTNTVLMAYLMYKSGLVPRFIPVLGLVGGPLVFAYNTGIIFGINFPAWVSIAVVPIFAWELSLALWMIFKGFNQSTLGSMPTSGSVKPETNEFSAA